MFDFVCFVANERHKSCVEPVRLFEVDHMAGALDD